MSCSELQNQSQLTDFKLAGIFKRTHYTPL